MPEDPKSRGNVISFATAFGRTRQPATTTPPLCVGETGAYGELVQRPLPEGLSLVFIPSLAALLTQAQDLNGGAELTERQVLAIRDGSSVMVGHNEVVRSVEEGRGYADIDAADAWRSWLRLREAEG
jgi:hypothetical protein